MGVFLQGTGDDIKYGDIMNLTKHKILLSIVSGLVIWGMFSFPAHAATEGGGWEFQLAPYAWLAGQSGTAATLPPLPPADLDIDFYDDILGNINGALMLVGEARKDRLGVVLDLAYNNIEIEDPTPGPFFTLLNSKTKSWIVSVAGFYRLVDNQKGFLDLAGGLRYWSVDSRLTITEGLLPARAISNEEDWFDPIIGFKGSAPLGDSRFFVSGFALIGGFGVGSDFMWDANLNLGYQWTETFSTTIGYRYLDVDYEDGDFLYDVAQDGLILGLSWRF
jgi:hypothetical protein